MRTLKITTIAVFALLLSHSAKAQIYIDLGVGYGAPALRQLVAVEYNSTQNSSTFKGIYSSLGQGIQPQLVVGYKINPNTGIEIGYGFLLGSKISADINDASNPNFTETGTQEMYARMHRLSLGTRVAYTEGNIHPYIRMGIIFGVGAKVISTTETTTTGPSFNETYSREEEYTGGLSIGFTTGLGLRYHISESFGIYLEAGLIAQNYSPAHSEITRFDIDGQDQLGGMTTRQKQTDYVDEFTDSGSPIDGEPDQDLKFHLPMSSWAISAGVHFYFGAN